MSAPKTAPLVDGAGHRQLAVACFNNCWGLIEKKDRTQAETHEMIALAYASWWHWGQVPERKPVNWSRGAWQVARVLVLAGQPALALEHAKAGLAWIEQHKIGDFDLAFAHESVARAYAALGDQVNARKHIDLAMEANKQVAEDDDREMIEKDLATIALG